MAVKVILTFLNGSLKGRKCEFTEPVKAVIGRANDCEVQLPAGLEFMEVSRHHCELDINPPALAVRDLGSRNGTFVNGLNLGQRLPGQRAGEKSNPAGNGNSAPGWHTLKEGDELRIGDTVLRVELSAKPEREKAPVAAAAAAAEPPASGGRSGGLWPLLRLWSRSAAPC
jgi:pSer/pThr/pTyr-binding forkhead associated (FHA) protein